jgi:hypothetical protein
MHAPVAILAGSTLIATGAFHLHVLKNPDAVAAQLLNKTVPWLALGFVSSMALMATQSVLDAAGISLFGAEPIPDLFAEVQIAPQTPLFERIAVSAFGVGLASLALCNFWLTQTIFDLLWNKVKRMRERRAHAREAKALMDTINADETLVTRLEAEKRQLLRELEPQASFSFAVEFAALVQKLRGPVVSFITGNLIWKKRPESVIERKDEPELDLAKFKELAAASDLTPQQIFAAFNDSQEVKKK